MGILDQGKVDRIKHLLKMHPKGLTISDLSFRIKMNRNLMAKYLDMLLISGQVEMDTVGSAKVFHLSHLIPLSAMLDFSFDLVIMLDDAKRILQVNEPALSIMKMEKTFLLGKKFTEIDTPLFQALALHSDDARTTVQEVRCEIEGAEHVFRVKQVPTAFDDGNRGTTLILEDVTAQMKYQEMLEKREARYREIIEDQPELICRISPDFSLTYANPAFTRYYNVVPEEITRKNLLSFIYQEDLGAVRSCLASLSKDTPVARCQTRAAGESVRWQDWTYGGRFLDSGELTEIQGSGHDITREKEQQVEKERQYTLMNNLTRERSEQQVRECEKQYRTLIQYLNMGQYRSTADPQGRFLWGNTSFINILGYESMTDLQGINVIEIFAQPEARKEILQELRRNGFVKKKLVHLKRRDQTPLTVSVTAVAELNEEGEIVSINGVVQDVSGFFKDETCAQESEPVHTGEEK
ncbi:MAG: PAS domain S-box protein [Methanomicrobiales archaeon]|nr:PAS domain S-box protein [Methanomicrobiales archaeon]